MNKKGFTLIEVMTAVLIIAAIALISFPILINVMKKNKDIEADTFKENAVLAAKTYFNLNKDKFILNDSGYAEVSVQTLIDEGYLDETKYDYDYKDEKVTCTSINECEYQQIQTNKYGIGDKLTIHSEKYYIIKDNGDYITLLKENPLTTDEINEYGLGHINKNLSWSPEKVVEKTFNNETSNYGAIQYYSNETCGYFDEEYKEIGCNNDYSQSEVKYVVDAWYKTKFTSGELATDSNGYQARLITKEELETLGCSINDCNNSKYSWVWNKKYQYWTMTPKKDDSNVWYVNFTGNIFSYLVSDIRSVRPVINVYKSAIEQ